MPDVISSLPPSGTGAQDGAARPRRRRPRGRGPQRNDAAKWIWIREGASPHNCYLYARKSFSLAAKPATAVLRASACDRYKLYVNGRYVGKGPVRSGAGYTYFDTYDVRDCLVQGANVVAFLVHYVGESTYAQAMRKPGLICDLSIDAARQRRTIVSDESWKVCSSPDWTSAGARMSRGLGFQECYDAEKRIEGWNQAGLDEQGWQNAVGLGVPPCRPWGELREREIPPLREVNVPPKAVVGLFNSPERRADLPLGAVPAAMGGSALSPLRAGSVKGVESLLTGEGSAEITTPRGDWGVVIVLDFGHEVFGNVDVGIGSSGRGFVDIGYAETLEGGRVKANRGDVRYADRVILGGGGLAWQSFEPRAFRYVQLEFRRLSQPMSLDYVRVNETTYPTKPTASFECSDATLNEIWHAGALTARLCMEDAFVDSPWSERAQWWPDARIASRAAYYAFGDTLLLAQGLRQIASSQKADGAVLGLYPAGEEKLVPDFALFWVFSVLDHYAFSDDKELLEELYPAVQKLMGWFGGFVDEDGLLADVRGDVFIDWAEIEKKGEVTALNCLYFEALQVTSLIAGVLGRAEEAEEYLERAHGLRQSINRHLYLPSRGLYADCRSRGELVEKFSRQTNTLAALFDIPDQYVKATIYRQVTDGPLPELITPYFASHLLEALYAGDRHEEALELIRQKWGPMVESGPGTLWEYFDQGGGLCHAWATSPTRDLLAEFVGIKPIMGSNRFAIAPHTGGLAWAKGSVGTATGPLDVEWRTSRNAITIKISVPRDVRVDVFPPCEPDAVISVDGKHWGSRFVTLGSGRHLIRATAARPEKPAVLDRSLEPQPIPHVEILKEITPIGRRRAGIGRGRTTTRRRGAGESRTGLRPSPRRPVAKAVDEATRAAGEQKTLEKTPRRRPRGGGGRRPAAREPAEPKQSAPNAAAPKPDEQKPGGAPESRPRSRPRRRRPKPKEPSEGPPT